jgi:predicted lactoylglutathione lyase
MFDHVTLRASDRAASEDFYAVVLKALGVEPTHRDGELVEWSDFSLMQATDERGPTRRLHLGFAAPSRAHVDAFWRAGIEAGHPDDGRPGPRPQYREDYYGAFLLDPDGNSAEAVHHGALGRGGVLDHLWIRVADVAAARSFYLTVAPHAGLCLRDDGPERVRFAGASGSFSLVAGAPSEHVHLAFGAARDSDVDAFHRAAVAAGHRDNGPPGERPQYHPGYYAAYALDPDGTSVEVVVHHRV